MYALSPLLLLSSPLSLPLISPTLALRVSVCADGEDTRRQSPHWYCRAVADYNRLPCHAAAFTPSGSHFVVACNHFVTVWGAASLELEQAAALSDPRTRVRHVAVTPNEQWVVLATKKHRCVFDLATLSLSHVVAQHVLQFAVPLASDDASNTVSSSHHDDRNNQSSNSSSSSASKKKGGKKKGKKQQQTKQSKQQAPVPALTQSNMGSAFATVRFHQGRWIIEVFDATNPTKALFTHHCKHNPRRISFWKVWFAQC